MGFSRPPSVRSGHRGYLLLDAMLGLIALAAMVATIQYGVRLIEHHFTIFGTVAGFERLNEGERSYRRAGFTGDLDFQRMQILMPGVRVDSPTQAHFNGLGNPYSLEGTGASQVITTLVDTEAQASQVVAQLAGHGRYEPSGSQWKISMRPVRTSTLQQLVQQYSMHVTGPHGTHLHDRLNFAPSAQVTIGSTCLGPNGETDMGGFSIADDGSQRIVACIRADHALPGNRRWEVVSSSTTPVNPPPRTETCGDGTVVTSRSADCKDCPGGTNIAKTATCPSIVIPRCGDGTAVVDTTQECKDCWDGSNIHVVDACPVQPAQQCGDGTRVTSKATDCQDCSDGSNIPNANACPVVTTCWDGTTVVPPATCPVQPSCGDGTLVTNQATECKNCTDGTNIHLSKTCPSGTKCWNGSVVFPPATCPPQPTCGDGSPVTNPATDCKDCANGKNIPKTASCPVACSCGNWAPTLAQCPPVTMKTCPSGCPSVCPSESCSTPTRSGPTSCTTGFNLVETTGACAITASCVANACPCGAVRNQDGTCPVVEKQELGARSCPSGYAKVKVSETACTITHECRQTCPCNSGTVTHPATCPIIEKKEVGPKSCTSGYTRTKIAEDQCTETYACQQTCPCNGGTVTHPTACPPIVKKELGPKTCPQDYVRTVVSSTPCDVTYACQRNCPCEGGLVTHPAVCPAVEKKEVGPKTCPSGYTRTQLAETECAKTFACQKTCPCNGGVVTHPTDCPPIVPTELGARSCAVGCNLVTTAQTPCTITRACQQTCWNNAVMVCGGTCPAKPVSCANGNAYPNCCCPQMTPIVTEYVDKIVWSCPAKPITGFPIGQNPGPHWTVVTTETECSIHRDLVCTGSIGACFGPGNYCATPRQVWYGDNAICDKLEPGCTRTGYVCGEGGLGP